MGFLAHRRCAVTPNVLNIKLLSLVNTKGSTATQMPWKAAMDHYESAEQFLKRLDAGDFDSNLPSEIKKLSKKQLEDLAQLLAARDAKRFLPSWDDHALSLPVIDPAPPES